MREREEERIRKRREGEGEQKRERERGRERPKHLCSCANDSRDHNRLPVPWSKQALSRRFQGACRFSTDKKLAQRLDSLVRGSRLVERDQKKKKKKKKKRVHVSWSSRAVLEMAAFGAHAKHL